jgi:hypothetical protein
MKIASARRSRSQYSFFTSPSTHAQTRTRERVTVEHIVRQTQLQTDLTHFVFEQLTQRFNQTHLHLFRQAAHVVVRFDDVCFTGCGAQIR